MTEKDQDKNEHIEEMKRCTERLENFLNSMPSSFRLRDYYWHDELERVVHTTKDVVKKLKDRLVELEKEMKEMKNSNKPEQAAMNTAISFLQGNLREMDESAFKLSDLGIIFEATTSIQTQWKPFGIALGIQEDELKRIEDCHFCDARSLYEVLKYWIENTFGTWKKIVKAVLNEKVDRKNLAETIKINFIKLKLDEEIDCSKPIRDENPIETFEDEGEESINNAYPKPIRHEKPIEASKNLSDADLSLLFTDDESGATSNGLDWKVLGVLLKLPISELEDISFKSTKKCQEAMIQKWISTGKAYWSVLVNIINGPALCETKIAVNVAKHHFKSNYKAILKLPTSQTSKYDDGLVDDYTKNITHRLNSAAKEQQPSGIVFIITVAGIAGTDEDSNKIRKTFKDLGFATLSIDSPTATQLVSFVCAAAQYEYPLHCKHRALYVAGHGGFEIADSTNLPQAFFCVAEDEKIFVQRDILKVFNGLKPKHSFMLFFDCCLSTKKDLGLEVDSYSICVPPPRCFAAYGTSPGMKAIGYEEGGLYTSILCKNLRGLKEGDSLTKAMDLTHGEMEAAMAIKAIGDELQMSADAEKKVDAEENKVDGSCRVAQQPIFISRLGPIYFNGIKSDVKPLPLDSIIKRLQALLTTSDDELLIHLTIALSGIIGMDAAKSVASTRGTKGASMLLKKTMQAVRSEPYIHGSVVKIMKEIPQLESVMNCVKSGTKTYEEITQDFITHEKLPEHVLRNEKLFLSKFKKYLSEYTLDSAEEEEKSFEERRVYDLKERNEDGQATPKQHRKDNNSLP